MDRRRFVLTSLAGAVAAPFPAGARPTTGIYNIGYLSPGFSTSHATLDVFRGRLAELGYREGQTVKLEIRFAEGDTGRLPDLAAELVQLPSVIVTGGSAATVAAKRATTTVPIVMAASLDPIRDGLIQSLARPGGNVTGLTVISDSSLIGKRLQLIKELVPDATRLALVPAPRPRSQPGENWIRDAEVAARSTGLATQVLEVQDQRRWDQVFPAAVRGRADIAYVVEWAPYIALGRQIAEEALRFRIPTLFGTRSYVEAGGLISYGTKASDLARRAADYVDKILKGAKPSDLPVEQATTTDSWSSISRPRRRSASQSRPHGWRGWIRSSIHENGPSCQRHLLHR